MRQLLTAILFLLFAHTGNSQVVINEAGIAPTAPSSGSSEFIELFNKGGCAVDISCYTLVLSSTSGSGNATGWTIKIPSGKLIASCGYFLIGGNAGQAGVTGGTGYPTGGTPTSYAGTADLDVGTLQITANAVYMKQSLNAGSLPNSQGQLTLLDASGAVVSSVSYNNGNNAASYPLSAYTTCGVSGNTKGTNNIANPSDALNNVNATFSSSGIQGIRLNASNTYQTETSLTPGASNALNGGSQLCCAPVLNSITNPAGVCYSNNSQTVQLDFNATNSPTTYSISWNTTPANSFVSVTNASLLGSIISIIIPANTAAEIYTGNLTVSNSCGNSCTKTFTITVNSLPIVSAGTYSSICPGSSPINLTGSPSGGTFAGTGVNGNNFTPPSASGNYTVIYTYTDPLTNCTNQATTTITVLPYPVSTYITQCSNTPFNFHSQIFSSTGFYTVYTANVNGCMDTNKLYLVVTKQVIIDTIACNEVKYNDSTYTQSTTISEHIYSAVIPGCDSIRKTIHIVVKKATTKDTTACVSPNNFFTINGQTFTTSGNYILHTLTMQGCDSTINLHLFVTQLQTIDSSGCDSVRYNGTTYSKDTNFIQIIKTQNTSCDSIQRTVNIHIKQKTSSYTIGCISPNQSYFFNGQTYSATGSYAVVLTNAKGCDSLAYLYLLKSRVDTAIYVGCDSVLFNSKSYYSNVIIKDTVKSIISNCDSLVHVNNIVINKSKTINLSLCIPTGGSYSFFGQILTSSGIYIHSLKTATGCDSILRLQLVVAQTQTQEHKGCDSIIYNNTIYYSSTTVADTLRSQSGCDSVIRVHSIVVNRILHTYSNACLAPGQTYNFNGQIITTTGNYVTTYQGVQCDSIVHLYLVATKKDTLIFQGCDTVRYNNVAYTASSILQTTIPSSISGCDSIQRTIRIVVNNSNTKNTTVCIRQGQAYLFNNQNLTTSGFYTAQYKGQNGCDSIVKLYLVVATAQTQNFTGCDSLQLNGQTYYNSKQITDTIRSTISGCDSLYKVSNITIRKTPETSTSACLREGQAYNFNGQQLTVSGQYTARFTRQGNCDSIVHLNLVIPVTQSQTLNGCGSVTYNNVSYTLSVVLKDTLRSTTNCDSVYHTVQINVKPIPQTFTTACIQQGQSYNFNGQILTTNGYHNTTYQRPGNCDSLVQLYLTIAQTKNQTFEGCDSVVFKGRTYYSSTIGSDTTHSMISGCDSIVTISNIVVNPVSRQYITTCLALGQSYNFNGQILTATGHYQSTYNGNKCDSIVHLYLIATKKDTALLQGCNSVIYHNATYTSSTTLQEIIPSSVTGCDSIQRTIHIVISNTIINNLNVCIGQGESYSFNNQNLTATGYYTANFTALAGCDSIVHLHLMVSHTQSQSFNGCDSLLFRGKVYYISTQIIDTARSIISGCDSLYTINNLVIQPSPITDTSVCLAEGQMYNFNGQVLTASGNYTTRDQHFGRCDSIVHLKLVIAITQLQNINGCDSVIYQGIKYTTTTVVRDTVHSVQHCDSIYRIAVITIKRATMKDTIACILPNGRFTINQQTFTAAGNYTIKITNSQGCDSTINLHLNVTKLQTLDSAGCDSVRYNSVTYTKDTSFVQQVVGETSGCDSIQQTVNITIKKKASSLTTACIKPNGTYPFHGTVYSASGYYTAVLTNAKGCDSLANLYLVKSSIDTVARLGCDSAFVNNKWYYSSATLKDTVKSVVTTCDSIIHVTHIIINKSETSDVSQCVAPGGSYDFYGQTLTSSGNYIHRLQTSSGCDSVVRLTLLITQQQTLSYQGCSHYVYNGVDYTSSIALHDTLKSNASCDSVVRTINIVITHFINTNITACIKQGQSYSFNNQNLGSNGYYTATFKAQGGCDSVVNLYLVAATTQTKNFSGCDSVQVNNKMYYASTQVTDTVKSVISSCDSLYNVSVITVKKTPEQNASVCLKEGQTYDSNGQALTVSGQYTTRFTRPGNCDSIVHLSLVIPVTQSQTLTDCDSLLYRGIMYYASTTVKDTVKSATACDSIYHVVNITIKQSPKTFTTACIKPGETYNFNGQNLTTGGYYNTIYHTASCDSSVRLYLTVTQTQSQTVKGCDSVLYKGEIYYSNTSISDTAHSTTSGCDSIINVTNIVVNPIPHNNITACVAPGQVYNFNGQQLTQTGNYTTTYTRQGLCDSVVHLYLIATKKDTLVLQGCNSVTYNNVTYSASTTLQNNIPSSVSGCDSIQRTIQIIINSTITKNTTACIKQEQSYSFNNQTLTTTGYYTATYTAQAGCDSVVRLYLTVSSTQNQTLTGCDSLLYKGLMYYASTQVSDTVKSAISGCDSLYNLTNLVIEISPSNSINVCLGQGQTYNFNGQVLTASGNYTTTYQRPGNCDSTVKLKLVIAVAETQNIDGCDSVVYKGIKYTASTVLQDTVHAVQGGCDSVYHIININVKPSPNSFTTACIIQGQNYNFNGQTLTTGGYYKTTYKTSSCDSTVTLYLTVTQKMSQTMNGCDSIQFNGHTYYASTSISDTLRSAISGCDSVIHITALSIQPAPHTYINACVAPGQTYNFNGQALNAAGHYQTTYKGSQCDSTVHLYLVAVKTDTIKLQGCSSVTYNNIIYTSSTTLSDTVHSSSGCDSLLRTINIVITPTINIFTTACIKQGQSYSFNGQSLTSNGYYTTTFTAQAGCDSVVRLYLSVSNTQDQTFNGCDSIRFKGITYYASSQVTDTVKSLISGCDSLYTINHLVVQSSPVTNTGLCLGEGQTYNFNGQALTTTGNYSTVYTRQGLCDSVVHLYLVVTKKDTVTLQGCSSVNYNGINYISSTTLHNTLPSSFTGCDSVQQTINIVITPTINTNTTACIKQGQSHPFNGQQLTQTGNYTAQLKTQDGCDSIVHLYLVVSKPQTQTVKGCDSVLFNGKIYYANAQVTDTTRSLVSGCDSLYNITDILVQTSPVTTTGLCLKTGQSYDFNGQTLTTSGDYTTTYQRAGMCDSTVHLKLVIPVTQTQILNGCDSLAYKGIIYHASTAVQDTVRSIATNCDSIYHITQININASPNTFTAACIQEGQRYNFNGQVLTTGGLYQTTFYTSGCDSTVKLYLTVSQVKTQTFSGCDSIQYKGIIYHVSTILSDTTRSSVSGCDSIVSTVIITVNTVKHQYITACLAPGQTYNLNGQILTITGHYQITYAGNPCDSIVHLYLMATQKDTVTLQGCNSVTYNNVIYTSSTTLQNNIPSSVTGCDSIQRTIHILITDSISKDIAACIKQGQSYQFNKQTLTTTGFYTATFTAQAGCDSVVHLYLTVNRSQTQTLNGCDSLPFRGNVYYAFTQITDTVRSAISGCDSLYTINDLHIQASPIIHTSLCLGEGQTYNFNGQTLTTSGNYTTLYSRTGNCDSTVHLKLVVAKTDSLTISGCGHVTYNNITYTSSTILKDTIRSTSNCDSIYHTINITVYPKDSSVVNVCLQQGQTYSFNGQTLTTSGTYTTLFKNQNGCDSTVFLHLVIPKADSATIKGCDSVMFNGKTYLASVTLKDTLRSVRQCDSVYNYTLIQINKTANSFTKACLQQGQSYNLNGQQITTTGYFSATIQRQGQCDSVSNVYAVFNATQSQTLQGCGSVNYQGVNYMASTTLRDTVRSVVTGCDSIVQVINIIITPPPVTYTSYCAKEGQSYNFNGQVLTTTGNYTTVYTSQGTCDSTVHLYFLVSQSKTEQYNGCGSVYYNGVTYTSSTTLQDTVRSVVTSCDSIYYTVQIVVNVIPQTSITVCLATGGTYHFNGQQLTQTGNYTTAHQRPGNCDSLVHLYLLVSKVQNQTLASCDSLVYNGTTYTASAFIRDTIRSALTGCDSIINVVTIKINPKPTIAISKDVTICKGDSVTLLANSPRASISWVGYGNGNAITVYPANTTTYTALAVDSNGCSNSASIKVSIQEFTLNLYTANNPVLSGNSVLVQSSANIPYTMLAWQPQSFFNNQAALQQQFIVDTTTTIMALAQSQNGCKAISSIVIETIPLNDIYVPTAFSPNGDGKNDIFRIRGSNIKQIDFRVFNRWGEAVFATTEKGKGWDGTKTGKPQPVDTYVYFIKLILLNGQVVQKKGTVTLIR